MQERFEVTSDWLDLRHQEKQSFRDIYGYASQAGFVNIEGIRHRPVGKPSKTLLYFMHPSSTLQILPVPKALAARGLHVLCGGSRYAKNDTALIMEKVLLDMGAFIHHAKNVWNYEKVVIVGWSGGGSLCLNYQAEAEHPTIESTPAGDPVDIRSAKLIPGDAFIWQAAHLSRAVVLRDFIDPSMIDELDPDNLDESLNLYNPEIKPPYTQEFLERFRAAQLARIRRRTAWVKDMLETLKRRGGKEIERGFITHRTLAEPRWLDATIDPNDRQIGTCWLGEPETVNNGPISLARYSTLRSWLSQWSIDDTNVNALKDAPRISVPFLAIENSADDSVPQPHTQQVFDRVPSADKTMTVVKGANHYYVNQPQHLAASLDLCIDWLAARNLID